jgi:hypothetical protein
MGGKPRAGAEGVVAPRTRAGARGSPPPSRPTGPHHGSGGAQASGFQMCEGYDSTTSTDSVVMRSSRTAATSRQTASLGKRSSAGRSGREAPREPPRRRSAPPDRSVGPRRRSGCPLPRKRETSGSSDCGRPRGLRRVGTRTRAEDPEGTPEHGAGGTGTAIPGGTRRASSTSAAAARRSPLAENRSSRARYGGSTRATPRPRMRTPGSWNSHANSTR